MSYRCSIGPGVPGMTPGPPRISCDVEMCSMRITISGLPPTWFLDGKAPRGWRTIDNADGTRTDYCPEHFQGPPKGRGRGRKLSRR